MSNCLKINKNYKNKNLIYSRILILKKIIHTKICVTYNINLINSSIFAISGKYMQHNSKIKFIHDTISVCFNFNIIVGSQIVAHTQMETGDGSNKPNTINL